MSSSIRLVVFDVAGTTVLDGDAVIEAMDQALSDFGAEVDRDAIRARMGIPKPDAIRMLIDESTRERLAHGQQVDRIHQRFLELVAARYRDDAGIREADGASDVFRRLRARGVKVALDTGFERATLDVLLNRLGWRAGEVIDCSVTSDEVARGRPAPDLIRRAMELTGVDDSGLVGKVGDTPSDIASGHAARCRLVAAVSYGTHSRPELESHRPTHVLDRLDELLPLVDPSWQYEIF
jgi:phosphonatase-like hydrolase